MIEDSHIEGVSDISSKSAWFPAASLFVLTAGFIVLKTGRDALYFQEGGVFALPKAYIAIAMGAVLQAMIVLKLLSRFGLRTTRVGVLTAVVIMAGAMYLMAEPGGGVVMTVFFVLVPLLFSIAFSLTWLLGTELFDGASVSTSANAFARIGAASILGGAAGGGIARIFGPDLGPSGLIAIGFILVVISVVIVIATHAAFPNEDYHRKKVDSQVEGDAQKKFQGGIHAIRSSPIGPLLLAIGMAASLSAILIEFQFYLAATVRAGSSESNTVFFANVYLILSAASIALQLLLAPRLQKWFGISGSLLILPLAMVGGATTSIITASTLAPAGLRVAEGGLKSGVHRSVWEQAFLTFPKSIRAMAKVIIDGTGARVAEGIAACMLYIWLAFVVRDGDIRTFSTQWVGVTLIGTTALWLILTMTLRRQVSPNDLSTDALVAIRARLPDG